MVTVGVRVRVRDRVRVRVRVRVRGSGGHAAPELGVQRFNADVRVAIRLDSSDKKPVCMCGCV